MRLFSRSFLLVATVASAAGCGQTPAASVPAARPAGPVAAPSDVQAQGMFRPTYIEALLNQVFERYDHNRNGVIELEKPDGFWRGIFHRDERFRRDGSASGGVTVLTMRDLFYHADRDQDMKVTRAEMDTQVRSFDINANGILDARTVWQWIILRPDQEYERFMARYREQVVRTEPPASQPVNPAPQPVPSAAPSTAPSADPAIGVPRQP